MGAQGFEPKIEAFRKISSISVKQRYLAETKEIIMGDYTNEVSIISTLLRNIIDELNKLQSGAQSLTTTQKNLGISQPKIEQKRMKKDLEDPILGPQVARQPALLMQSMQPAPAAPTGEQGTMQIGNPEGTPGSDGKSLPNTPNQNKTTASPNGAVAANNQRAGGASAIPVNPIVP